MRLDRLTPEQRAARAAEMTAAERAEQGLPRFIEDQEFLEQVGRLFASRHIALTADAPLERAS